ncbi:thiamine phosphate synthase [Trinickia fusca]|uniref:Thiamine phosphate synthase n=1 Tax=Trinickia fusca TaxID=2419777 RepID=A0A494XS64_9BURK|nr:thiamine phosphate synthase [Trinickia fusca]RKP50964.1 thiamine phosphate synthase [Trinickia fusca]
MSSSASLPELLLVTPEPDDASQFDAFLMRLRTALDAGISLVQLRAKTLPAAAYAALAARAATLCHAHGARLILNGPIDDPVAVGADGVHLSSAQLMSLAQRPVALPMLLSAACHDRDQLLHAEHIGADLVTLSPVLPTASHPGAPTLGWPTFAHLCSEARVPIYALGGMTRADIQTARTCGAQGIAAISGLWPVASSTSTVTR